MSYCLMCSKKVESTNVDGMCEECVQYKNLEDEEDTIVNVKTYFEKFIK